jgi:hypothetical protein
VLQAGYSKDSHGNACRSYWKASIIIIKFRQKWYADETLVKGKFHLNPFSSSWVATYGQRDMMKRTGVFLQLFIMNTPKMCTSSNAIYIIPHCAVSFHIGRQFLGTWCSWFWATCKVGVVLDVEEPKLNLKGIIFWNVMPCGLIQACQSSSRPHSKKSQHNHFQNL